MATEFVIKRRRKRLQMDFGLDSQSQDPVTVAVLPQPTVDVEAVRQPLTIAVLPKPTSPTPDLQSDQVDLTVEGFLRRSARKTYSNQKKARLTTVQPDEKTSGSNRTTYKAKRGRRVKLPAKAKVAVRGTKARRKTRLAEALSRAVILTRGDPSEAIQDPKALRRNCCPLAFVTMNKFDGLQRRATEDDDTILDSDSRNEDDGSPANTCREPRNGVRLCKPRAHKSSRSERPRDGHPPLVLVPVREAEAAYSALFSRSRVPRACDKTPLPNTRRTTNKPIKSTDPTHGEPGLSSANVRRVLPNPPMSAAGSLGPPQEFTTTSWPTHEDDRSKSGKPLKTFSSLLASFVERARSVTRQIDSCSRE